MAKRVRARANGRAWRVAPILSCACFAKRFCPRLLQSRSRESMYVILSRQEEISEQQRHERDRVLEAHQEVTIADLLAQSFAQLVRTRNDKALDPSPGSHRRLTAECPNWAVLSGAFDATSLLSLTLSAMFRAKGKWKARSIVSS